MGGTKCLLLYRPASGGAPATADAEQLVAALQRVCGVPASRQPERQLEARCTQLSQAPVRGPPAASCARRGRCPSERGCFPSTAARSVNHTHGTARCLTRQAHRTRRRATSQSWPSRGSWRTFGPSSCPATRRSGSFSATCEPNGGLRGCCARTGPAAQAGSSGSHGPDHGVLGCVAAAYSYKKPHGSALDSNPSQRSRGALPPDAPTT